MECPLTRPPHILIDVPTHTPSMRPPMPARSAALLLSLVTAASLGAQSTALPRSTPERQGIASAAIRAFVLAADSAVDAMHSVMVVRHGHVVAEGWWAPYDAATPHVMFSLSKSFTATAVGLAVAEGRLSLDDEVVRLFPDEAPATPSANLARMRVRDLLRMTTGHGAEPPLFFRPRGDTVGGSLVRRFLAYPVADAPGTHFVYNTPATYMLSAAVEKRTGTSLVEYLQPRLFAPLGIARPTWDASADGVTLGGFGLRARTEDVAKFGLLYLQKGVWNGRQLLPAGWVDSATARQTSNGSDPRSDWSQGYGFQFWRSRHGYRGDGAFGQYMLVLPEQDAVVAITSGVRDMQQVMQLVWDRLLPAMRTEAMADDAPAQASLKVTLAGLTMRVPAGRATSPVARRVSGRWYAFPENARGIRAVALDLAGRAPALRVRTAAGETRTPLGLGTWVRSASGFTNGVEREPSVPSLAAVAASGAWTTDSTFTVKIALPETPFHTTMTFAFTGDRLVVGGGHHVGFGPVTVPAIEGTAAR